MGFTSLILFLSMGLLLGIPLWLYFRQPSKYREGQEKATITVRGKKIRKIDLWTGVMMGLLLILGLIEYSVDPSLISKLGSGKRIFFTSAIILGLLLSYKLFWKKYSKQQKAWTKAGLILLSGLLLLQLLIYFFL